MINKKFTLYIKIQVIRFNSFFLVSNRTIYLILYRKKYSLLFFKQEKILLQLLILKFFYKPTGKIPFVKAVNWR